MTDASSITVHLTLANVPSAGRIAVTVKAEDTPAMFRDNAAKASKIPLEKMRLIFRGRLVGNESDKKVIEDFKLEDGSVIHCMGKPEEQEKPSDSQLPATAGAQVTINNAATPSTPSASDNSKSLTAALLSLRTSNPPGTYLTAVTTLEKVLFNITQNPMEEKYRKVKRGNAAFNKRLGTLPGGEAAMLAVGFSIDTIDGEECYIMHPSPDAWPTLMSNKAEVERAVKSAKDSSASAAMPPPSNLPGGSSIPGMPGVGMPGMGGMPSMTPEMQRAAAQMMQNPQQLQAMMQNPMVQNMIRNHPQFANSPMRPQIEQMMNDPQMLQQMSQMMQNPEFMNMMSSMGGSMGGMGNSMGGIPPMPTQSQQSGGNSGNTNGNDQELTEEEMIQEAIRRSLNENNES